MRKETRGVLIQNFDRGMDMRKDEHKTIYLNEYIKLHRVQPKYKQEGRYRCLMSGDRLEGFCDVLIYDFVQNRAELFCMRFSKTGVTEYYCLDEKEVAIWKSRNIIRRITYLQAMTLLGDAVRRNYKYQPQLAGQNWSESVHVKRSWQNDYDYNRCSLLWLLQGLELTAFVSVYLNAICNKDAVLLYDMTAESQKHKTSRELYAYSWNHALEDVRIFSFDIDYIEQCPGEEACNLYITVYGSSQDNELLSIDLCLKLASEGQMLHLLHEQVLEANHIVQN